MHLAAKIERLASRVQPPPAGDQGTLRAAKRAVKRTLGIRVQHRQMAHLPARSRRLLAVEMQRDARIERECGVPARLAAGQSSTGRRAG